MGNWLLHPCLLGGPQVGGNATCLLSSWGPQQKGQNQNSLHVTCLCIVYSSSSSSTI